MRATPLALCLVLSACRTMPTPSPTPVAPALEQRFTAWEARGPSGDAAHRARLSALVEALRRERSRGGSLDVVFVCTHNSRRSHMAQLLGAVAARRANVAARTFSAGTEATAFNPRAVAALVRAGFDIPPADGPNPRYQVRWSPTAPPLEAFSKALGDPSLPSAGFVAVMTCTQADAACPLVKGAVARVAVPYEDPKVADGTPAEAGRYDERVEQLGRDLAWVFREVAREGDGRRGEGRRHPPAAAAGASRVVRKMTLATVK
ncbi:MAG: protein-tyrosine-phosphatase [Myxococcaceae bacterium]|nr:protein-tyrosine-phosphatase [Myxococcaceae bacterium]